MSEFTNENLIKMKKSQKYNVKYSNYYYRMYLEFRENSFLQRSIRVKSCMNLWLWDMYYKNKILDLQRVNRCMNRFCPNCKVLDISKYIHKLKEIINDKFKDYHFYFLTLTVSNCDGDDLENNLNKLNKCFSLFNKKYGLDLYSKTGKRNKLAFDGRLVKFDGGIRLLEINYNRKTGYHPHFHIVIMTENEIDNDIIKKKHLGRYNTRTKKPDLKSDLEVQISQIWSKIWHGDEVSARNYDYDFDVSKKFYDDLETKKVLEVDFRVFDEKGIYEAVKYTVKDVDILNYEVFKNLVFALHSRRIRQGFGLLYNIKLDDDIEIGEEQELILKFEESPISLLTRNITELFTDYKHYKKISRKLTEDNNIV